MRKSKLNSRMSVIGGVSSDVGIVPPAAAAVAHVVLPENNPVLQRLLSDDEIAAIKAQRLAESPSRNRQHDRRSQVQRDSLRSNIQKAERRRAKQAKSAVDRHRNEGQAFKLGRATELTPAEEASLLGFSDPPIQPSTDEMIELEDQINKKVDSEIAQQIELSKPRNATSLPSNPQGEAGGISLTSNSIGVNPLPSQSSPSKRNKISPENLPVLASEAPAPTIGKSKKTKGKTASKRNIKKATFNKDK